MELNVIDLKKSNKKKKNCKQNINNITYYNYNKKGHYTNKCFNPPKN